MKNKIYSFLFLSIFLIILTANTINAESLGTYPTGEPANISLPVLNYDGSFCDDCVCTFSFYYRDINLVNRELGSVNNGSATYMLLNTSRNGEYNGELSCNNSVGNLFTTFSLDVTPTGSPATSTSEGIILVTSILVMALFSLFFFALGMKVNSGIASLIFIFISGTLLFTTTMFTLTVVSDNLSIIGNALDGYSTYLLVIKSIVSISVTFLVLFAVYKSYKIWGLKRGLRIE